MELTSVELKLIEDIRKVKDQQGLTHRRIWLIDIQTDSELIDIPIGSNGIIQIPSDMPADEVNRLVKVLENNMKFADQIAHDNLQDPRNAKVSIRVKSVDF